MNLSQRYASLGYSSTEFVLRMSREEIGNYLGLTLETVSRSSRASRAMADPHQPARSPHPRPACAQAAAGPRKLLKPAPRARASAGRQPDAGGVDPLAAAQTPLPDPYDYDEATPRPAKPARWQTVELGKPGHRYKIPVYANRPLGKGELADIKQVVVVIHGVKRDADRYYEYVTDLLERNPERARDTLVLAPRFSGSIDSGFAGMAAWRKASWEEGEDSVQAAGRPAPVSSFQVLDDLLRSLDDRQRLPALAGIVLAGHSGGAQLVQRYAVLNNVDGPLRRDGLALRYVIANPSSYLYLTNERPRPDGKGYAPYERGICPTYNQYKYGTDKLPASRAARRNPGCSCATRRATSPTC